MSLISTPLGLFLLEEQEGAVTALKPAESAENCRAGETLSPAARELAAYARGELRQFTVPLRPQGTPFEQAVWALSTSIPYGRVTTYGDLAAALGCPGGARAVGRALGKNPILILQPCHRVVSGQGLGGYRGGQALKRRLLELEGVEIPENGRILQKFIFTF